MLLLLLACSAFDGAPAQDPPPQAATGHATPSEPPDVALPDDFRACEADADCVVAPALAGLDHLPEPGETCAPECVVGVAVQGRDAWTRAVDRLAPHVPCDLEMEPCPPLDAFVARCVEGTCVASFRR